MIEASNKLYTIKSYLKDVLEFSDKEISVIEMCLNYIHEQAPTELPLIIRKTNNLISASEDLAWIRTIVNRKIVDVTKKVKQIKAPEFTMLTRQGRPSSTAIEYEILHNHPEISELEEQIEILNKLLDYFNHIEKSIDRYLWMLKESASYNK